MYDDHYLNTDFNYEDLEAKYAAQQAGTSADPAGLKEKLDESHKQ